LRLSRWRLPRIEGLQASSVEQGQLEARRWLNAMSGRLPSNGINALSLTPYLVIPVGEATTYMQCAGLSESASRSNVA
jgi:hypothetical protein